MPEISRFNRRGFLKRSLVAFGGAFLTGWVPELSFLSTQVPLFIPDGSLSEEGQAALQSGIRRVFGDQIELIPQTLNQRDGLREAVQSVFESSNATIFLGYFSNQQVVSLKPLVERYQKSLIVLSLGENKIDPNLESPYLHFVDLALNRAAYYLGVWSAQNLGKDIVILTEPILSGYDYFYAFYSGFEKAGGVVQKLHFVSSRDEAALSAGLIDSSTQVVFSNLSANVEQGLPNLGLPVVSVLGCLTCKDQVYGVSTWGDSHPLVQLGQEAGQLVKQWMTSRNNASETSTILNEESVYDPVRHKVYRKGKIVRGGYSEIEICRPVPDYVVLSDLTSLRTQVSTPLFL